MDYPLGVGDRVVCLVDYPDMNSSIRVGSTGVICVIDSRIGVRWDIEVDGHDCENHSGPHCKYGHGWWVDWDQIEPIVENDDTVFEFDEEEFNKLVFGAR